MIKTNSIPFFFLIFGFSFFMSQTFTQKGTASYYADKFHGNKTYSGEKYHRDSLTGAHKTLPMGTLVKITNLTNDSTVILKINDRMYSSKRIIDVSKAAALQLNFVRAGLAQVQLEVIQE